MTEPASRPSTLSLWFSPGMIGIHVTAILAIVVCTFAGMWQLGVYDARQTEEQADKSDVPAVELVDLWSADEAFTNVHTRRPVTFRATFRPADEQFWVTDRADGGAWLVAPVVVTDSTGDTPLLVVRGQASAPGPLPSVPSGEVEMAGVLQPTEAPGDRWNADDRTIGSLRIPSLINELPYNLWSGFVVLTTPSDAGLDLAPEPEPEPQTSWTTGGRNLGYGLQWWAFGLFVVFMWWRMGSDKVATDRQAIVVADYAEQRD